MSSFNKFDIFAQDIGRKVHNLNSDVLLILLTNTAPNAADTIVDDSVTPMVVKSTSNASEITAEHGYSTGGGTPTNSGYSQTSGTAKLVLQDLVFTASGGTFGPARYAVLYNSSAGSSGNRPVIGWWDRGSSVTPASGETLTIDLDQSGGTITLA